DLRGAPRLLDAAGEAPGAELAGALGARVAQREPAEEAVDVEPALGEPGGLVVHRAAAHGPVGAVEGDGLVVVARLHGALELRLDVLLRGRLLVVDRR